MPGLATADGTPTGGVFGFASLALELIKKLEPDYVVVAWDKKGTSIRRRLEILPTYKAGRKKPPEDFCAQIPILHELLEAFSWPLYECDDYEADDIMGALARQAHAQGVETCLITSDLDMLQLVGPTTHVYAMKKGLANIEQYDVEHFTEKYGITVQQFVDLKSLKGDSSDNIPGVAGIGEKTAIQLLQQYETLDDIYAHIDDIKPTVAAKLRAGKDMAYISKQVAEIWCDAPVVFDPVAMDAHRLNTQKIADILRRLEFTSLLRRLPKNMQHKEVSSLQGDIFSPYEASTVQPLTLAAWPETVTFDTDSVVYLIDDQFFLSTDGTTYMSHAIAGVDASVWRALSMTTVVTYDIKALYHAARSLGVELRFDAVHDIRQGAFLLDSLARDRSLSGLIAEAIDETNPAIVLAALWRVYATQKEQFATMPRVYEVAQTLDFPLTYMLYRMEYAGIKLDSHLLAKMSKELGDEHAKLEQEMYTMAGCEFNIASPAQLADVLFTKLGLPTTGVKKGKTGYSTGQKELDKLRGLHPIVERIEQTRELAKLKNTYVDTLPKLVDDAGRLHTTFNQDVAATGRLSSTDPNLQNIPVRTELGRRIREAFIPEEGNVFVSADYSQFELRLAAVLANDTKLIENFNSGVDIHTQTASEAYGIPLEDVTKVQRRAAKVINFGVLYGMSPHGLSAATGMTFIESKEFIDRYFELRAPIRRYIDATLKKAEDDGYVETYAGRRRPTPDVKSSNYMVREAAKRAAANMPIQGTEADLMKLAMLRVDERLGDKGRQVLQVHDSILIECPKENANEIADMLREVMEAICPELPIQLNVDVTIGENWGEL